MARKVITHHGGPLNKALEKTHSLVTDLSDDVFIGSANSLSAWAISYRAADFIQDFYLDMVHTLFQKLKAGVAIDKVLAHTLGETDSEFFMATPTDDDRRLKWFVQGGFEEGEDSLLAGARELREETGQVASPKINLHGAMRRETAPRDGFTHGKLLVATSVFLPKPLLASIHSIF